MSRLDDELKLALSRHEPPADFSDRVLARIALQEAAPQPRIRSWWRPLLAYLNPFQLRLGQMKWAMVGALACLLVATVGVHRYREQQRLKAEGEVAKAQVMFALRIASTKLNVAQKKVVFLQSERVN